MKQYVIDDIRETEMCRLKTWCAEHLAKTCFDNVFWLHLDESLLNEVQQAHSQCRPFYLGLTLEEADGRMVVDMAVRTARSMHCECMRYLDARQFTWLDGFIDTVFAELNIRT